MKDLDIEDVVFLSRARLKTRGADGADQLLDRIVDAALTVQEAAGHRSALAGADGRVRRHGPAARVPAQEQADHHRRGLIV